MSKGSSYFLLCSLFTAPKDAHRYSESIKQTSGLFQVSRPARKRLRNAAACGTVTADLRRRAFAAGHDRKVVLPPDEAARRTTKRRVQLPILAPAGSNTCVAPLPFCGSFAGILQLCKNRDHRPLPVPCKSSYVYLGTDAAFWQSINQNDKYNIYRFEKKTIPPQPPFP